VTTYRLLLEFDLLNLTCPLQLRQPFGPALLILGSPLLRLLVLPPLDLEPPLLLGSRRGPTERADQAAKQPLPALFLFQTNGPADWGPARC
jgi:hypothetical protein